MKTTVIFKSQSLREPLVTMVLQDIPREDDTLTLPVEGEKLDYQVLSIHRDLTNTLNPIITVMVSRL